MKLPGFVGPSSTGANFNADCEDTYNLFVEKLDTTGGGRSVDAVLLPTPGFIERFDLSPGPIRCIFTEPTSGRIFAVSGYVLWELFANFTKINRGSVALDANPATIAANAAVGQLFVWSGDVGYCYDLATDVLTTVLVSGATMGDFMDGRFLSLNAATSTFSISDLNDGLTWDPTQFAQRTGAGDPWVALKVEGLDIWLVGTRTSEVWYDSGAFPFPFTPRPDALVQHGTVAPYSVTSLPGIMLWVEQNAQGANMIVNSEGYRMAKASTLPVDLSLQKMSSTADAVAFTYQQNGHTFYVVNFPTGKLAWTFDATTQEWAKRAQWDSVRNEWQAYGVQTHAFAFGLHLAGDRHTGLVYEMSTSSALEAAGDGAGIRRLRRFMGLSAPDHARVNYPRLEIEMVTGIAPGSGQGTNPQVMLRCSNDNGHTWSPERWSSGGRRGQFGARVFWTILGQSRDRVFEITMSDPIPWTLSECWVPNVRQTNN